MSGASFSGSFNARFATSALSSLSFRGSFFHAKSDVSQKIATIDPGLGNRLAIAGPLGGATGFGLGFHPLNVVEDAFYEANLRKTGGSVGFGYTTATPISVSIGFYGSAGYSNISFDERFGGSIPGFLRDFAYQSSGRIDQLDCAAASRLRRLFRSMCVSREGPPSWRGGFVEVGPDFSRGSGSDRLSFTGFPDSSISLNKQTVDFGLSAGLLLSLRTTGGMKFGIEGRYVRDTGFPVFERNGTDPTTLELKAGDALIGRAFMSVPFAPPPP